MGRKALVVGCLVLLVGSAGLLSCSPSNQQPASDSEVAVAEVDSGSLASAIDAAQRILVTPGFASLGDNVEAADFSLVQSGSYSVDSDNKVVYVDLIAETDEVATGCRIGEDALKVLDLQVHPDDDFSQGFGTLFGTYHASVHVDNPDGTLDLDGMLEAGASSMLWQ